MTTFGQLIQKTTRQLHQVYGTGVQQYSEDFIADILNNTYDIIFREYWWPEHMQWFARTVDGATGLITQTIDITHFRDIRSVYRSGVDTPLSVLPTSINPYNLAGTTALYIDSSREPNKPLLVWPLTCNETVYINGRVHPAPFTPQTEIDFDDLVLIYGAAWQYSEDEGTNPATAAKFQTLFEARLKQMKQDEANKPIQLDPLATRTVTKWESY